MALTPEQSAIVKTYVEAIPELMANPHNSDGASAVADYLKVAEVPDFIVWKTKVSIKEIMSNGFDYTRVDNMTVGKSRIWEYLMHIDIIDPSKETIRKGIDEAWLGQTGPEIVAHRAAIQTHLKRNTIRLEKLLATGAGTTVAPATMGHEGPLTYQAVQLVMGWV